MLKEGSQSEGPKIGDKEVDDMMLFVLSNQWIYSKIH